MTDASLARRGRPVRRILIRNAGAPPRPRQADIRRNAIVAAAIEIFTERGMDSATMDEVAERAGVAKGTLYHYFASKTDLVDALRRRFCDEVESRVIAGVDACDPGDWLARLDACIGAAVETYLDLSALHDVVYHTADTVIRHPMMDFEFTRYLSRLISDGAAAGAWTVDDPDWAALIIYHGFHGGCDEAIVKSIPAEDLTPRLLLMFRRMLAVPD